MHDNRKQRVASKNLQAKKRVKQLQVDKGKRKGSGRVGSTAEKIRRLHTDKGIEQLQSTNQGIQNSFLFFSSLWDMVILKSMLKFLGTSITFSNLHGIL